MKFIGQEEIGVDKDEIKAARELCQKATPGPIQFKPDQNNNDSLWWNNPYLNTEEVIAIFYWPGHPPEVTAQIEQWWENFGKLAAASRELLPRCLDEIERLQAEVAIARERLGPAGWRLLVEAEAAGMRDALEKAKCECKYKPYTHQYKFDCLRCKALASDVGKEMLEVVEALRGWMNGKSGDMMTLFSVLRERLAALDKKMGRE